MVDHRILIERGLRWAGVSLRYPFDPHMPVLYVADRMFALLGASGDVPSVNLKAVPDEAWLLRQQYPNGVLPGYHMNKKHWNTVLLNGSVPDDEVLGMLHQSYQLVCSKLTKREREALGNT